jgi:hypothetical protein
MDGLANTNWMDYMFKDNAKMDNYNVALTGGNEKSTYALSMNYIGQRGLSVVKTFPTISVMVSGRIRNINSSITL